MAEEQRFEIKLQRVYTRGTSKKASIINDQRIDAFFIRFSSIFLMLKITLTS